MFSSSGHDDEIVSAHSALQKTRKEVRTGGRSIHHAGLIAPLATAVYARCSTSDQTCDSQLKELREYVARRGWRIAGEFIDTGFSGAKASRPALDALMKAAALKKFDCVAVFKLDRFGRSVLHLS